MNIGQASKHSGISAKMIRYYEEIGLLEAAQRSASGYRIYSETDLKTLNFLKHARELGFSSEQMKELISLWKNTDRHSAEVKALTVKTHCRIVTENCPSPRNGQYFAGFSR